jgi:hypothetical protein
MPLGCWCIVNGVNACAFRYIRLLVQPACQGLSIQTHVRLAAMLRQVPGVFAVAGFTHKWQSDPGDTSSRAHQIKSTRKMKQESTSCTSQDPDTQTLIKRSL